MPAQRVRVNKKTLCPFCQQPLLNRKIWFGAIRVGRFEPVYENGEWRAYHKSCWEQVKVRQLTGVVS